MAKSFIFLVFLSCLSFSLADPVGAKSSSVQCRDEDGNAVDWYVVYKFPYLKELTRDLYGGYSYAFITSKSSEDGWVLSKQQITDGARSIFGKTLDPIYKKDKDVSAIIYNDQPPESTAEEAPRDSAHAKGVVASDLKTGFWLIHSVPKLASPIESGKYEYPASGGRNGQIGMCISFTIDQLPNIVDQLLVMKPHVYSIQIQEQLAKKYLNLVDLKNGNWKKTSEKWHKMDIPTPNSEHFFSFSKGPTANMDLYADIVAPDLKSNLLVQTWRKNPGEPLPSECNLKYHVENVSHLKPKMVNYKVETVGFSYLDDHSKWAMSKSNKDAYICMGDINRMHSQYKRGGGTSCIRNIKVWKGLNAWIDGLETCG